MTSEPDLIQVLTADHARAHRLFDRIRAAPPRSVPRAQLVDQVVGELAIQSSIERTCLDPRVLGRLSDGGAWADRLTAERRAIDGVLRTLREREPERERGAEGETKAYDDARADDLVLELLTLSTAHFRQMEQRLFPRLQVACPPDQLRRLGEEARRARQQTASARPGVRPVRRRGSRVRELIKGRRPDAGEGTVG